MSQPSKSLSSVCEFIVDCEHKTAPTQDEGYPSIRTTNIARGWFDLAGVNRVSEEVYREWTRRAVPQPGDLILAREAPVGNVAVIPPGLKVCLGQRTVLLRPDQSQVNPRYLCYLLLGDEIQHRFAALSSGATVAHLNLRDIRGLELPELPPRAVQDRISHILSAYDDLIENNTRRIAILEEMAQAIYREWFVNFRFPGHEQVEMVESELGPVPAGWEVRPIGEVVETLGGGTPSTKNDEYWIEGDIVWFSPTDLTSAGTMFISDSEKKINELGLQKSSAKLFPPFSVMMTSRATIGVTAINTRAACTNQGFITCVPNEALSAYQIYFWIAENKEKIITLASGATFKEINKTTFRKLAILVPDPQTAKAFSELLSPFGRQIEVLQRKSAVLRQTRDLLLPKLVSGEIEVGVAEDELAGAAA